MNTQCVVGAAGGMCMSEQFSELELQKKNRKRLIT